MFAHCLLFSWLYFIIIRRMMEIVPWVFHLGNWHCIRASRWGNMRQSMFERFSLIENLNFFCHFHIIRDICIELIYNSRNHILILFSSGKISEKKKEEIEYCSWRIPIDKEQDVKCQFALMIYLILDRVRHFS